MRAGSPQLQGGGGAASCGDRGPLGPCSTPGGPGLAPPLLPGLKILGSSYSPILSRAYASMQRASKRARRRPQKPLRDLLHLPERSQAQLQESSERNDVVDTDAALASMAAALRRVLTSPLPGPPDSEGHATGTRSELMARLPPEMAMHPSLEVFTFPPHSPRLPGQRGLRVKEGGRALPPNTFLGPYDGFVSTVGESLEAKRAALRRPKAGERLAAIRQAREIETFSASLEQYEVLEHMAREDREALRAQHPTWQAEDFAFVSSGATGGNAARFGNAPQRDPHDYYASADNCGPARDPGCRANCVVVEVHVRDPPGGGGAWPLLALVTTAEVAPGGEILYDYGAGYWAGMRKLEAQAKALEAEAAAHKEYVAARRTLRASRAKLQAAKELSESEGVGPVPLPDHSAGVAAPGRHAATPPRPAPALPDLTEPATLAQADAGAALGGGWRGGSARQPLPGHKLSPLQPAAVCQAEPLTLQAQPGRQAQQEQARPIQQNPRPPPPPQAPPTQLRPGGEGGSAHAAPRIRLKLGGVGASAHAAPPPRLRPGGEGASAHAAPPLRLKRAAGCDAPAAPRKLKVSRLRRGISSDLSSQDAVPRTSSGVGPSAQLPAPAAEQVSAPPPAAPLPPPQLQPAQQQPDLPPPPPVIVIDGDKFIIDLTGDDD